MALRRDYMQKKWKINLAYLIFEHKGTPYPWLLKSVAIICWSWLALAYESLLLTSFPIFISNDIGSLKSAIVGAFAPWKSAIFFFHCWKPIVKHSLAYHCPTCIHSFEVVAIFSWEYSLLPMRAPCSLLFFIREESLSQHLQFTSVSSPWLDLYPMAI